MPTNSNLNILINGPDYGDIKSNIAFLECVAGLGTQIDALLGWNPLIAERINTSVGLGDEPLELKGHDVGAVGLLIAAEIVTNGGILVIQSHTSAAKVFSVLEGCGLFVPMADLEKCYGFAKPNDVNPSTLIKSVTRLLDTQDNDGAFHPELIVTCVSTNELPLMIEELEDRRQYALDRRGRKAAGSGMSRFAAERN